MIAEHALGQAQFACLVIGVIGFKVSFKVNEITPSVEPGEGVRWIVNGGGLSNG